MEDLIPDKVPVNTLHNVLRALLHERIPVRDIVTILETLANYAGTGLGTDFLVGKVREALAPLHHRPVQRGRRQAPRDLAASGDRAAC